MSSKTVNPWSPSDDAELERMWCKEGMSAGVIAKIMTDRTRNAVIGRVFRKGWCRPKASEPRQARAYPKRQAPKQVRRRSQPAPAFVSPKWKDHGSLPPTPITQGGNIASPNAKVWTERKAHQCAYPVAGEGADLVSCCNPTDGSSYCPGHIAIAYQFTPKLNTYGIDLAKSKAKAEPRERRFEDWAA
jgi:hypothetical protein